MITNNENIKNHYEQLLRSKEKDIEELKSSLFSQTERLRSQEKEVKDKQRALNDSISQIREKEKQLKGLQSEEQSRRNSVVQTKQETTMLEQRM